MPRTAAVVVLAIAALRPAASSAQVSAPGPYVIDVRGAMSGAPGDVSFYPPVTAAVRVPQRAFGFGAGAHFYALRIGIARLGLGLDMMRTRGSATTDIPASATSSTTAAEVVTGTFKTAMTVTTIAPQLSFNFGARDGWSYLSGGYGTTSTRGEVNVPASVSGGGAGSVERRTYTINYGGGARWFLREHLAAGFDVRFHRLRAAHGVPSKQIVGLLVGMSLR